MNRNDKAPCTSCCVGHICELDDGHLGDHADGDFTWKDNLPRTPSEEYTARRKFERILATDIYEQLSEPEYRRVLDLLSNQQIPTGKAIEAISELSLGYAPRLPELSDIFCIYCGCAEESKIGRLDLCPCRDSRSLRHKFYSVGLDQGENDKCLLVP